VELRFEEDIVAAVEPVKTAVVEISKLSNT
jgi:hypothetical protein